MDSFIQRIIDSITSETHLISVVNNPDGFLSRPDTQEKILKESGLLLLPMIKTPETRYVTFMTMWKVFYLIL